jgi:hypothetical protein
MILIYLDPGSGSFLIQLAIAALAGLTIFAGSQWSKIKRLLGKNNKKTKTDDDEDDELQPGA